ncbi:conserved hypothetical protein [Catenulispora acidiphila DSM 44928]|uniref:Prenyltransferase/squalene oxidase n=1 Tax=Catenulispora acidiphila (strain DSM 44928 / JCM 14897 / NBRC 102108 / NRRL B-24433 / ID139908) TaxID=479433 RepID=C7QIE5_CATAD|nr:hypothetical protein [Catenulispora acidiphila]ACU75022.1 conserved hypothetical protein [Catenulispora acidiphila DSM 44928]
MEIDLGAAVSFVATHARVIERRRLHLLVDGGSPAGVLAALDAYRNPDGGYGWGLEPDQRSSTSQPVAAMHALEVLATIGDDSDRATQICDWLAGHAMADGGIPFGLPCSDTAGCAPHWTGADAHTSSLQMTAQLAAQAHRVARHRKDIAEHPWLVQATSFCLDSIDRIEEAPHPYELMFVFLFLDAVADHDSRADRLFDRVLRFVVPDSPTSVPEAEGEVLHLLDFSAYAGSRSRSLFDRAAITADLHRLASQQQPDGGWQVTFPASSPAAALEWRGYATLQAVATLRGGV